MTEDTLRQKAGLSEEDITLLHKIKSKPVKKTYKHDVLIFVTNSKLSDANREGTVIIDKVCTLAYPLMDSRTDRATRINYLEQEDLMMQPEDNVEPISEYHKDPRIHWTFGVATVTNQVRTIEAESMRKILTVYKPSSVLRYILKSDEAKHVSAMMNMTDEQLKLSKEKLT